MTLTGDMLIGSSSVPASDGTMKALNPATGQQIEPDFALGGPAEVDRAARLADEAFDSYNRTGLEERAAFLELIADRLDGINGELAERAALETGGLPRRAAARRVGRGQPPGVVAAGRRAPHRLLTQHPPVPSGSGCQTTSRMCPVVLTGDVVDVHPESRRLAETLGPIDVGDAVHAARLRVKVASL